MVGTGVVEAQVEAAITVITTTIAIRQPMQASHTTANRCHRTATGAGAAFMIIHPLTLRTRLAHRHNNMAGVMVRVAPEHTRRIPRTTATLTRMAVGDTNRGRPRARTAGVDITPDPQAEVGTMDTGAGDIMVVAAEGVADTAMDMAVGSAALRLIRVAIVLAPTMVATAQAAVPHCEGVVEAEVIRIQWSLRPLSRLLS
jgi:hypothetical protein